MRQLRLQPILWALLGMLFTVGGTAHAQSSVGTYIPGVPAQFFDNSGNPCNACLLDAYLAGTSTRSDTYSEQTLATPNANPIVLDSAGRATIFLGPRAYKFVLRTSAGSTLWTRDNIQSIGYTFSQSATNSVIEGRLTLTSATPVTTADVTGATTVYFTPFKGNRISLWNGSTWELRTFEQLSFTTTSMAVDTNYDVFIYLDAQSCPGSCTNPPTVPAIEFNAWSTATARATDLTTRDGVLVKNGDSTRRYVGTVRTNSGALTIDDSVLKRHVWNYYHRVGRPMRAVDATATWTYTTATWRQARATAANQVSAVIGWAEVPISADVYAAASNSNAASVSVAVCIGQDSTSTCHSSAVGKYGGTIASSGATITLRANLRIYPTVGYHYYSWLEYSTATGTTTWYGSATDTTQTGIVAVIDG